MADPERPEVDAPLSKRAKTAARRALLNPESSTSDTLPSDPGAARGFVPPPFRPLQCVTVSTGPPCLTSTLPDSAAVASGSGCVSNENVEAPFHLTPDVAMLHAEEETTNVMPIELVPTTAVPLPTLNLPKPNPVFFSNLLPPMIYPVRPGVAPAVDMESFLSAVPEDEEGTAPPSQLHVQVDLAETVPESPTPPLSPPPPASSPPPSSASESVSALYEGSPLTTHDCMVAILTYAHANRLSGTSTCELIKLMDILLPQPNNLAKSTTIFKKYFKDNGNELKIYFFCSNCWRSRNSTQDICNNCSAPNRKVGYYITCSLEQQIQRLYARPGFCEMLQYKNIRKKENEANIEDVYDSRIYKEAQENILRDPNSISFTWYTDGVQVFEVSTFDLWLSMLTINELPPKERHKAENVLISGIWGADCKPHPNIFLLPMYHEILKVNQGVSAKPHGSQQDITVKGFILFGTCDCPAKAKFMNMKGHSGYHSCPKCFIKGEKSERTENVMVFPHEEHLELRNEENFKMCFTEGVKSKEGFKGVFGPTVLFYMFSGPFIDGMTIDSMHSQFMGNLKHHLKLWFDEKYSNEPFSLRGKMALINDRLRRLNLPHFVQRLPIDVDKALCYFKASLCRNLFFYILPIILYGVLEPKYFDNVMMMVNGNALLNKSSISDENIVRGNLLLNDYSEGFQQLYGLRHMTSNIHLTRHLAKSVTDSGPMFITSCFMYEDLNGKLCALVHGTRHVIIQISNHLGLLTDLPLLIDNVSSEPLKSFCLKAIKRSKNFIITEKVSDHTFVVGKITDVFNHSSDIPSLVSTLYGPSCIIRYFDRLYKNNQYYVSQSYEVGSRVSSYTKYHWDGRVLHGNILKFVKVLTVGEPKYLALIQRSLDEPTNVERFVKFCGSLDVDLVSVSQLQCVSFGLCVSDNVYIVDPLNDFELE